MGRSGCNNGFGLILMNVGSTGLPEAATIWASSLIEPTD